ncbi:protein DETOXIFICATION 56-like [Triticum dicoccoides]|uniref:protein DETOXIFICATION 56-like n=1 Tax=Triticum dicoccoides TaxID=85692 RepID=UPI000E79241F|nr:protein DETOXIFICATION 56-like [Triticum dicoccoides]
MDPPSSPPPPHDHGQHDQEHQEGCPAAREKRPWGWAAAVAGEARAQRGIALPLIAMNLTWFAKQAVTTAFLGRLGDLELAAGTLGFSFANATGFAVLTGLCGAMDPICGQAHGAGNAALLRRTLLMATAMLLAASLPIALLWLRVDTVLLRVFGQQPDIAVVARRYVLCLLPDLAVTSFLAPLKSYLSSQEVTLPTLFASAVGLAVHVPLTACLARTRGVEGVAAAVWLSDLVVAVLLSAYVLASDVLLARKSAKTTASTAAPCARWWWPEETKTAAADWLRLIRLAVPCCLNTCLEWWCYEILILLTGRLPDARRAVAVIAITLNFDYLLFAGMLSLSVSASVRVSNSLGAGDAAGARRAGAVSIVGGVLAGALGGLLMLASRRQWPRLYTRGAEVRDGVGKAMKVMAALEVVNFPLNVCGGIVRGTARPAVGMYAVLGGFYLVALPVGVALGFRARLGIEGLLAGFIIGAAASLTVLLVVIARMDWGAEADKARLRTGAGADGEPNAAHKEAPQNAAADV